MQIIRFFPRQAVAGGSATLYSEIYEVPDAAQVITELRLYSYSGTGAVSATIQDSMSPTFAPDTAWRDVASNGLSAVTGLVLSGSGLQRFVRAKLTVASTITGAIVAVEGVTKDPT